MPITTRTLTRDMPNGDRIVAHLELREAVAGSRFDEHGLSPGFSATTDTYYKHGTWSGAACQRNGREPDSFGADHQSILRAFPKLESFVALHLSDPNGLPMHAESNGWYWYCGSRTDIALPRYCGINGDIYAWRLDERGLSDTDEGRREYCRQIACETLRVDEIILDTEPRRRRDYWPAWGGPWAESLNDYTKRVHDTFDAFVAAQRERYHREAADAAAWLKALPE